MNSAIGNKLRTASINLLHNYVPRCYDDIAKKQIESKEKRLDKKMSNETAKLENKMQRQTTILENKTRRQDENVMFRHNALNREVINKLKTAELVPALPMFTNIDFFKHGMRILSIKRNSYTNRSYVIKPVEIHIVEYYTESGELNPIPAEFQHKFDALLGFSIKYLSNDKKYAIEYAMLMKPDGSQYNTFHSRNGDICLGSRTWVRGKAAEALNNNDANALNDMIEEMRVNLRGVNLVDYYEPHDLENTKIYDFITNKQYGRRH